MRRRTVRISKPDVKCPPISDSLRLHRSVGIQLHERLPLLLDKFKIIFGGYARHFLETARVLELIQSREHVGFQFGNVGSEGYLEE